MSTSIRRLLDGHSVGIAPDHERWRVGLCRPGGYLALSGIYEDADDALEAAREWMEILASSAPLADTEPQTIEEAVGRLIQEREMKWVGVDTADAPPRWQRELREWLGEG